MKQFLFVNVATTCASLMQINISVGNAVVGFISGIFNLVNWAMASVSKQLLLAIDKERYEYTTSALEQRGELIELELLKAATKVKEDALTGRVWTSQHTMALNRIGSALHMQCGWEPARIHGYLRQVVESIPGMIYSSGDDFEA